MATISPPQLSASSPTTAHPPRATVAETIGAALLAVGPLFAKGLIIRRPLVVALLEASGLEALGVATLQRLRARHGDRPLLLRTPVRDEAVLLSPKHVREVLARTPDPFQSDSIEKHAALDHFQPDGVLVSRGEERDSRRRVNEQALEPTCPVHSLAPRLTGLIDDEVRPLLEAAVADGALSYRTFKRAWFRMVRAAVLGAEARNDEAFTARLNSLRRNANWAFLKSPDSTARDLFLTELQQRLERAPPKTLGAMAVRHARAGDSPADQVAQWMFAFDAASITTFRAIALLSVHPDLERRAVDEARSGATERPFLRACILDTLRLWPTTPAVLRQVDQEVDLDGTVVPAGTTILIHLPFFHRDESRIPYAHRFVPDIWLDGTAERWPFAPFSAGPAECPARNLVLMLASSWMAAMLAHHRFKLRVPMRLTPSKLPATFDQFHLKLRVSRREIGPGEEQGAAHSVRG